MSLQRLESFLRPVLDPLLEIVLFFPFLLLKGVRAVGVENYPWCRRAFYHSGVFPIRDHYYEPQFLFSDKQDQSSERKLPALNLHETDQLAFLAKLDYADELIDVPDQDPGDLEFFWSNGNFVPGDAEVLYQVIRHFKPRRVFEIGSGFSTRMAHRAILLNREHDPLHQCHHLCIEPYQMPWLEDLGIDVRRSKVEEIDFSLFANLERNDLLFIDSSHIIRPDGDVLAEYLHILPLLQAGVIVHIHDIFSPRDYPKSWLRNRHRFWNEQYLVEAILVHSRKWKILAALNFLKHEHYAALQSVAPQITPSSEPGSLYLQKTDV